jgi:hypothetical protein
LLQGGRAVECRLQPGSGSRGYRHHRDANLIEGEYLSSSTCRLDLSPDRVDDGMNDLERLACRCSGRTTGRPLDTGRYGRLESVCLRNQVRKSLGH